MASKVLKDVCIKQDSGWKKIGAILLSDKTGKEFMLLNKQFLNAEEFIFDSVIESDSVIVSLFDHREKSPKEQAVQKKMDQQQKDFGSRFTPDDEIPF